MGLYVPLGTCGSAICVGLSRASECAGRLTCIGPDLAIKRGPTKPGIRTWMGEGTGAHTHKPRLHPAYAETLSPNHRSQKAENNKDDQLPDPRPGSQNLPKNLWPGNALHTPATATGSSPAARYSRRADTLIKSAAPSLPPPVSC